MNEQKWDKLELELLTQAILKRYGYDFRDYSPASLKRRVTATLKSEGLTNISELIDKVVHNPEAFLRLLDGLTVTVTQMFRDPAVYKCLREKIMPYLLTYPEIKVWNAGCATGEEVYSVAILLKESGLYPRSIVYGTDINPRALARAREGIISGENIAEATKNYIESGGTASFSRYYTADYGAAILDSSLKTNLVFSDHNLVTDFHFGEMNLIMCRNVLIYFTPALQQKVLKLLWDSLRPGGFIVLGSKERLDCTANLPGCQVHSKGERIYQKRT